MAKTFYDIFEVGISATPDEIRAAYKRMVQRHHPDKHRGHASSEELLKAINYAYSILSDPRKRANYDAKLANSINEGNNTATANGVSDTVAEDVDEAFVRSPASASASTRTARDAVVESVAPRPFNAHVSSCSKASHINSWLALIMLLLMFIAVTRFFYQIAIYETSDAAEPSGISLFFGIIIGAAIASGVVWLAGKMVAYTLPLVWPMNLIFRAKVRSDLNPEHRRIASVVLVMGILLTFAMPELDLDGSKQNELAVPLVATTEPALNKTIASQSTGISVGTQSQKNTTALSPEPQPVPPLILERDVSPSHTFDRLALAEIPARSPIAEARAKPIEQEKPIVPKTAPVVLPAKEAVATPPASAPSRPAPKTPPAVVASAVVEKAVAMPPAIPVTPVPAATVPEAKLRPSDASVKVSSPKNIPAKKEETREETRTVQNDAPDEGSSALSVHRKRAQQGIADAQYQLGRAYEKGDGVARDYRQAQTWYRKAADQGHGPAQHSLGSMYMLGKGVAIDPVSAYVWLNLAVNQNVSSSQQALDYLVDTLTPEQLANAKRRVAKWSPQTQSKR